MREGPVFPGQGSGELQEGPGPNVTPAFHEIGTPNPTFSHHRNFTRGSMFKVETERWRKGS